MPRHDEREERRSRRNRDEHILRRDKEGSHETLLEKVMRTKKKLEDKKDNYFKPKEGQNRVRIMPSWRGRDEEFYVHVPTHRNIGPNSRWAACLNFWGEECAICRQIERLSQSDNSRSQNAAQQMMAKVQVLLNVGYPNEEDGIIKPWSISENWLLEILGYFGDPDFGDFTHPRHGFDYIFTRTGQGLKTRYNPKQFARKPSPILITDWKEKLINLDAFPKKYTRAELRAFLRGEEEDS